VGVSVLPMYMACGASRSLARVYTCQLYDKFKQMTDEPSPGLGEGEAAGAGDEAGDGGGAAGDGDGTGGGGVLGMLHCPEGSAPDRSCVPVGHL
jgi:hypothetical protein